MSRLLEQAQSKRSIHPHLDREFYMLAKHKDQQKIEISLTQCRDLVMMRSGLINAYNNI